MLYVDASAAVKLLVAEAESEALVEFLDTSDQDLVGLDLLETELRRYGMREAVDQDQITAVLDAISLFSLLRSDFHAAGILPGGQLRSLDALHLQGAMRLNAEGVLTYDLRMAAAAAEMGISTYAPGRTS